MADSVHPTVPYARHAGLDDVQDVLMLRRPGMAESSAMASRNYNRAFVGWAPPTNEPIETVMVDSVHPTVVHARHTGLDPVSRE